MFSKTTVNTAVRFCHLYNHVLLVEDCLRFFEIFWGIHDCGSGVWSSYLAWAVLISANFNGKKNVVLGGLRFGWLWGKCLFWFQLSLWKSSFPTVKSHKMMCRNSKISPAAPQILKNEYYKQKSYIIWSKSPPEARKMLSENVILMRTPPPLVFGGQKQGGFLIKISTDVGYSHTIILWAPNSTSTWVNLRVDISKKRKQSSTKKHDYISTKQCVLTQHCIDFAEISQDCRRTKRTDGHRFLSVTDTKAPSGQ